VIYYFSEKPTDRLGLANMVGVYKYADWCWVHSGYDIHAGGDVVDEEGRSNKEHHVLHLSHEVRGN